MENLTIYELVRKNEKLDKEGNTQTSKYVSFDLRATLEKIDAYLNSKHTSGEKDYLGLDKPFFNIVTAACNIWYRATDIDRKNIQIRATKANHYILSFLQTILLQEWMRKNEFGIFLNEWGRNLAKYGSAVSKFVEKGGKLYSQVISWNSLIVDPIDFDNNAIIEKLWLTPAQLLENKAYDKDQVRALIENRVSRENISSDGQKKDNKDDFIPVYEVHGNLPLSLLTGDEEDVYTYVQQMHVVSFLAKKEDSTRFDEYTLISGQEARSPYQIDHLIKEDNRTLAIGAVENLFEAQWQVNHSIKQIKDHLDLASKIVFQTSDTQFVGQNILTDIENGDIMIYKAIEGGSPLTMLNNKPDIAAIQSYQQQWQVVANQINGISEAMLGENPPSGSAWRQTQAILQESHSLFELMTENKGLGIGRMLRIFVIPHLIKKLDTTEEISALLEDYQIKQIDSFFLPNEANRRVNKKIKDTVLSGQSYDTSQQEIETAQTEESLRQGLASFGNQRFIPPSEISTKTWKEVLKDAEWNLEIDVTNEEKDTQAIIATLTTILQSIASNPLILQDSNAKLIFNKILELTGGISPIEISTSAQPATPMAMPVGGVAAPMTNLTK